MNQIVGSGVFLHNLKEVLLVHENRSGLWGFPKGRIEYREHEDDCWRRELCEETRITSLPDHQMTHHLETLRYKIAVIRIQKGCPLPKPESNPNELLGAEWIELSKIRNYKLNAVTKNVIRIAKSLGVFKN